MKTVATRKVELPRQKPFVGWLLAGAGTLAFIASIIPAFIANSEVENDGLWVVLAVLMFGGGAYAITRGKRHLTPVRDWEWVVEQPFPILYLRSFNAERNDYSLRYFSRACLNAFGKHSMSHGASWWMPTFQAQLAMLMNRIGTYVAVGQPDDDLSGMGAVRCYIGEDWEQRIKQLLRKTRIVVLRAGTTEGLGLEIRQCKKYLRPEQLLMILPFRKEDYRQVRDLLSQAHGIHIPEERASGMLMRFRDDWKPILLEPSWGLAQTLTPYFQANGITPPGVVGGTRFSCSSANCLVDAV